jgi:hypothetical protein
MTESFVEVIKLKAHCVVFSEGQGNDRLIHLTNGMRCNFFYKNNYYSCRITLDSPRMSPGSNGVINVELIAFVDIQICIGDVFDLTAAKTVFAKCDVISVDS